MYYYIQVKFLGLRNLKVPLLLIIIFHNVFYFSIENSSFWGHRKLYYIIMIIIRSTDYE